MANQHVAVNFWHVIPMLISKQQGMVIPKWIPMFWIDDHTRQNEFKSWLTSYIIKLLGRGQLEHHQACRAFIMNVLPSTCFRFNPLGCFNLISVYDGHLLIMFASAVESGGEVSHRNAVEGCRSRRSRPSWPLGFAPTHCSGLSGYCLVRQNADPRRWRCWAKKGQTIPSKNPAVAASASS